MREVEAQMEGTALLVSDRSDLWFRLQRDQPELGNRVVPLHSGRDCLRAIEDPNVRIAVLDDRVPDLDLVTLTHLIRRIRPDLGVAFLVSETDPEEERQARQAGVLFYGAREGWKEIVQVVRKGLCPRSPRDLSPGSRSRGGPVPA